MKNPFRKIIEGCKEIKDLIFGDWDFSKEVKDSLQKWADEVDEEKSCSKNKGEI